MEEGRGEEERFLKAPLSMDRPSRREVLDCGSPLPLWNADWPTKAAEGCRSPRRWRASAPTKRFRGSVREDTVRGILSLTLPLLVPRGEREKQRAPTIPPGPSEFWWPTVQGYRSRTVSASTAASRSAANREFFCKRNSAGIFPGAFATVKASLP